MSKRRGEYVKRDAGWLKMKVKGARELLALGKEITGVAGDVKLSQQVNTDTVDHMVSLFTSSHTLGLEASKRYVGFDAKSSKAADVIMRVHGMINKSPVFHVAPPRGASDAIVGRFEDLEAHLNALEGHLALRDDTDPGSDSTFWQLLGGRSYMQLSHLPDFWDKSETKRKPKEDDETYNTRVEAYRSYMGPPVILQNRDPRMVFPVITPLGYEGFFFIYKVQRFELSGEFERKRGKGLAWEGDKPRIYDLQKGIPAGEYPTQSVVDGSSPEAEYVEYVDDVCAYYMVDGELVDDFEHHGGLRVVPATGLRTGLSEFQWSSVGILWAVRNEIPQYDFMRTLWVQKAYLDVFPQLFAQLGEKDDPLRDEKGKPIDWAIEPMSVKQIRGVLVNALKDAESGADFRAAVEMFASSIDAATISGLARGMAGAQQPGYSINQLSQAMRSLWSNIIVSRERQWTKLAQGYCDIVTDRIRRPVSIFQSVEDSDTGRPQGKWLEIDPEKLGKHYMITAKCNPELPIDEQGRKMTMAKMLMEGNITWEDWVREGLGKSSPEAYRKQTLRDAGIRAFFPKAAEMAMTLGQVEVTNRMIKSMDLTQLNPAFALDAQQLAAQEQLQPAAPGEVLPAAGGEAVGTPTGGPPGELGREQTQSNGVGGAGIEPTVGANPADPAPGFRGP